MAREYERNVGRSGWLRFAARSLSGSNKAVATADVLERALIRLRRLGTHLTGPMGVAVEPIKRRDGRMGEVSRTCSSSISAN
uniref:Uncharacterized protein n=1 Tax=Peronospora matthiolae TaxID=2874970 RepID=A0AAV1U3P0_9STRA